jgi:alpha-L-arabinofuranosidase
MKSIQRAAAALCLLAAQALAAPQVGLTVDATQPGPVINKNIYGQFVEHLGTGVYGGMWVGPESPIPNIRGWRKDVVAALKELHPPVLRWPGGCFADQYRWRDGIGARRQRPVRINPNGNVVETNAVGTHEFFDLLELVGAEAYITGNAGTGSARDAADWVEYMTGQGESTLAQARARNGHRAPFKVAFFGIGHDSAGCGGNMTPEQYANLYNQYAVFIKARAGDRPALVASGGDEQWIDALSTKRRIRDYRDAISLHYHTVPNGDGRTKGGATGFDEQQWISTLQATLQMDSLIARNVARLEANAPKKKLSLVIDEWGTWYDPAPGTDPAALQQQNSLRDALVAALNFHIFHAHADRVSMANIAQMVNVLQAMILTDGHRMVLTPTYYAFRMYRPFQDAAVLPVRLDNNPQYRFGNTSIAAVSATAARARDGKLYVGLVNTDPHQELDVAIDVAGAKAGAADGSVLSAATMDAHNTFATPRAVAPVPLHALAEDGKLVVKLPPKSVAVVALRE